MVVLDYIIVYYCTHVVYQKLLGWEPLLELMGLEGGRTSCMGGELLELVLVIRLHAPKVCYHVMLPCNQLVVTV